MYMLIILSLFSEYYNTFHLKTIKFISWRDNIMINFRSLIYSDIEMPPEPEESEIQPISDEDYDETHYIVY